MKRLLLVASLAVVALGLGAGRASAAGLLWKLHCCKCGYFCVKPYNAFSPVCCGTVTPMNRSPSPYCPLPDLKKRADDAAPSALAYTRNACLT